MLLVEPMIPALRRYARSLLKNAASADDLVQDTLERTITRWSQRDPDGNARAWVFTILHNLAVNKLRQTAQRQQVDIDDMDENFAAQPPGQEERLLHADLLRALDALSEDQRSVLLLVSVEDLSYAEAAKVLGVPIGTVMSRLSRGRERLMQLMDGGTPNTSPVPSLRRSQMNTEPVVTEDHLHAYIDGALSPDRRLEVETFLASDEIAAQRVARFAAQRAALRAALAPIAAEPIPPALHLGRLIARRGRAAAAPWLSDWRSAAAAVLILGIGGAGGWSMREATQSPPNGLAALAQEASATYAAYAPDPMHPVEFRAADKDELLRWIGDRLHRGVTAPDLTASGFRFMGGRLVVTPHGPAGMLMYDDDHGTRIAMVVRPMANPLTTRMSEHDQGDLSGFAWSDQGLGYSLVGPTDAKSLHPIADEMRRQIDQKI